MCFTSDSKINALLTFFISFSEILTSSMSISDKLNRFLEIKEIPVEKREYYRNVALDIMESVSKC